MNANKPGSKPAFKSDLAKVEAHSIQDEEYDELPELTDEMLSRANISKGGRPIAPHPSKAVSLRLPVDVLERWKATGPGWLARMIERLSEVR